MTTPTIKHAIVVHIANINSPLSDGGKSIAGHMWFTLIDDFGNQQSYGFAPKENGATSGHGEVFLTDDEHYLKHTDYKREISSEQFDRISEFIRSSQQQVDSGSGRWSHYNGFYNSCIDFTWQALHQAGLTDSPERGWQGNLIPYFNDWFLKKEFLTKEPEGIIDYRVNDLFHWAGAQLLFYYDPLVLDLDGDGIETVSRDKIIYFDGDNNGIKTITGWIAPDDGLLVMDRNGNGVIDSGAELFGDATLLGNQQHAADGFTALADQDSNHDGKIDHEDLNWKQLRVWRDLNQDGLSQDDELFSLAQLEIARLDLADNSQYQPRQLSNGNQLADASSFTRTNGQTGIMRDVNFADGAFRRQFATALTLSETIKALPNMQGSGTVRDLREAASLSQPLQDLLIRYRDAGSRQQQRELLDTMLTLWADTANMSKTLKDPAGNEYRVIWQSDQNPSIADAPAEGASVAAWERKLHILEAFNGQHYFSMRKFSESSSLRFTKTENVRGQPGTIRISPSQEQIKLLDYAYKELQDSVYSCLLRQTRHQALMNEIGFRFVNTGMQTDFSALERHFAKEVEKNSLVGIIDLLEFNGSASSFLPNFNWLGLDLLSRHIAELEPSSKDNLLAELPVFHIGGDVFRFNKHLFGGPGNDAITGNKNEDNILFGGAGNDLLSGGYGNDIYIFNIGDGEDIISDYEYDWSNMDTLQFGPGISANAIRREHVGNDLVLIINASDKVTIKNCLNPCFTHEFLIEKISFNDGTTWNYEKLFDNTLTTGTPEDDILTGLRYYRNNMHGGAGNDILTGGCRGDIISGGSGDDSLEGLAGSDTYIFNIGDGRDTILDDDCSYDYPSEDIDILKFGIGIHADTIQLDRIDIDLILKINACDQVTIRQYFDPEYADNYLIEKIVFADGPIWSRVEVLDQLIYRGTNGDDTLDGIWDYNNHIEAGAGNDIVYGGCKDDLLAGGAGNDTLQGESGDDTYVFRRGDGSDIIIDHDDSSDNTDKLTFDVDSEQLWLRHLGNDLEISILGTDDKVTIQDWYSGRAYQVEEIQSGDNRTLLNSDVDKLVNAMAAFAPPVPGQLSLPPKYQATILPVVASSWH